MDCPGPPFAGNHNPVVTGEFFHLLDVFSAFSVGSFIRKNVSAVKFSPQRYLKGILNGIVIAYLTLPVMKELKDKTTAKLSFMMFVEWFIWGACLCHCGCG